MQFSQSTNVAYQQQTPKYQLKKPMGSCVGHRERRQGRRGVKGNMQATHTNKLKCFSNLYYCFTFVYDVDNPGTACPVPKTTNHMPNIPHYDAQQYANQGASMANQQKSLADGTGEGMRCIFSKQHQKSAIRDAAPTRF